MRSGVEVYLRLQFTQKTDHASVFCSRLIKSLAVAPKINGMPRI
jgi:hypothetical protein|tara:strand:- start:464 stop:595 length:132 start_codon:yes stop_codon:yes gene_type:complete